MQAVWGASSLAVAFVGMGGLLFVVRAFQPRMQGRTKVSPSGIETDLAPGGPDVAVRGKAGVPAQSEEDMDSATLLARWPTLGAALQSVPLGWTKNQVEHDDGQQYIHLKSPQGGFDVVINVAACDSPAPKWLMVAISVMEDG
jgi:hypothetical protein